jgi:hypothetical protein
MTAARTTADYYGQPRVVDVYRIDTEDGSGRQFYTRTYEPNQRQSFDPVILPNNTEVPPAIAYSPAYGEWWILYAQ